MTTSALLILPILKQQIDQFTSAIAMVVTPNHPDITDVGGIVVMNIMLVSVPSELRDRLRKQSAPQKSRSCFSF